MTAPLLDPSAALFLDFDGTLAPLQSDPDTVFLPEGGAEILLRTAENLHGALVILSGRDIRDLASRIPDGLWRAGGHGAYVCPPGQAPPGELPEAPENLVAEISALIEEIPGVRIESKGPVLALHYREIPEAAGPLEAGLTTLLEAFPEYTLQSGKMVMEARPASAHKGKCVSELMKQAPFSGRGPIMVGDDTTDEDAMRASLDFGGTAIKVGSGATAAPYRLADPAAVWDWLKRGMT